jgi:hypothetical protein
MIVAFFFRVREHLPTRLMNTFLRHLKLPEAEETQNEKLVKCIS